MTIYDKEKKYEINGKVYFIRRYRDKPDFIPYWEIGVEGRFYLGKYDGYATCMILKRGLKSRPNKRQILAAANGPKPKKQKKVSEKDYKKAIEYVRKNKSWSKACEEYALETIGEYRCPIDQASSEIDSAITELMDEYGRERNFPDGWWYDFGDTDDVFFKL